MFDVSSLLLLIENVYILCAKSKVQLILWPEVSIHYESKMWQRKLVLLPHQKWCATLPPKVEPHAKTFAMFDVSSLLLLIENLSIFCAKSKVQY